MNYNNFIKNKFNKENVINVTVIDNGFQNKLLPSIKKYVHITLLKKVLDQKELKKKKYNKILLKNKIFKKKEKWKK